MEKPITLGAVIYDPKVTVIWGIIREFFEGRGCPLDVSYYKTYELQDEALVSGKIEIAWSSPLAWLDVERRSRGACRAIAMRDTDRDLTSVFIVKKDSPARGLADLKGSTIGFGAKDSPQATLIPIETLRRAGLIEGKDYKARRFDIGVGLHGDHVGGELDAWKALAKGEVQASCMLGANWDRFTRDGTIDAGKYRTVGKTDLFDHCNFSVLSSFPKDREKRFLDALFAMSYDDPKHKEMMDMEGLKKWLPGRTSGYAVLTSAVKEQKTFG